MTEISVVIIDPEEQRWPQQVDDQAPVGDVLPVFVRNLELPKMLNYELLRAQEETVLSAKDTLAAAGVLAGAELLLRPVRDAILKELLDHLYEEAKGFAMAQLWDMVKDRLMAILRLDPRFRDPANLRKALEDAATGGRAAVDAATLSAEGAPKPGKQVVREPTSSKAAKTQARKGCSPGCAIAGVAAVGGVIVIGGIITLALVGLPALRDFLSALGGNVVLGTGDVQVTLRWDSSADLDLHVMDPRGEEIYFRHDASQSGGRLDVDANADCGTQSYNPVENIYWPTGGAPSGTYSVSVVDYSDCDETGTSSYEVVVKLDGRVYGTYVGEILGERGERFIVSFDW